MRDGNADIRKTGSYYRPLLATPYTAIEAFVETKEPLDRLFRDISAVAWQRYDREKRLSA